MATENLGATTHSLPVNADLSASQYCFVKVNSSSQWALVGDGEDANGVLQDDPAASGRPGSVALTGNVTKVKAGGTVTAGNVVSSDSTGRAVNSASGDYILGRAVTGTTTANEIVEIILEIGHSTL